MAFGARLGKTFYLGTARNFGFKVFVKTKFGSNISRIILLSGAPGTLWGRSGTDHFGGPSRHDSEDFGDLLRRMLIVFSAHLRHTKYDL